MTVVGADAGLHVVVWPNRVPRTQEEALITQAHAADLGVHLVTPLYAPAPAAARPGTAGLVMGYASLDEQAIARGVQRLGEVLEAFAAEAQAGHASR